MRSDTASTAVRPTKTHRGENFPTASLLIGRELRGPVLAFYRFVRQADDIADSPDLDPEEKLRRLDALEAALARRDPVEPAALALADVGERHPSGPEQARVMLGAFRQDAAKLHYADWDELVAYCERSANPVGRFLLRLHGESHDADAPADALCTALQILNHLQDLAPDRERLDRVYLPVPWMSQAGGEACFFAAEPSPRRRAVLDAALDRIDALLDEADALVFRLKSRRLAAQSGVTIALARRLGAKLRAADPILGRVALGPADFALGFAVGVPRAVRPRLRDPLLTRRAVAQSGSSFKLGMSSLSGERRRAINAVYAYCRVIDDIADGAAPAEEKQRALAAWRREVDGLSASSPTPIGRELAWSAERFDLPRAELHQLLDGMETDAAERVRLADEAALDRYCRQVAGAVGVLSIHIFGAPDALDFAVGLGRTLQLVNILRDVDEDAAMDRVYVPLRHLRGATADETAAALVRHPDFAPTCARLAEQAAQGFAAAERSLAGLDRKRLRPAVLMMEAYRAMFARMRARGWQERGERARLTRADKLRLVWLALGAPGAAASSGSR
jgi:hydroxysqualene synthase